MKPVGGPGIQRTHYQGLLGADVPSRRGRAFRGASFEEYYTLLRRFHPEITRWKAAKRSRLTELNKSAGTLFARNGRWESRYYLGFWTT